MVHLMREKEGDRGGRGGREKKQQRMMVEEHHPWNQTSWV